MFGLTPDVIRSLKEAFSQLSQIEKVLLYGSRAKGNYKDGSDIDLTLLGKNLNLKTVYAIETLLEELYLPYTFDISIFSQIDNDDLIEHILVVGKVFYTKKNAQLPEGWEVRKLGEVCHIKGRIGYREYTKQDWVKKGEGAIPLSPSNINDNKLSFTPQFVVLKDLKCDNKFLNYQLMTDDFKEKIETIVGGAAVPTLSQAKLSNLKILLPPLPEQKRIVAILDKAFTAIAKAKANAEQNLKNAKELFESYLQGVFENKGEGREEKRRNQISDNLDKQSVPITPKNRKMTQAKLNQKMLNKIPIPFPEIEEQKTIVQKLDRLSTETKKLEAIYQQKIANLEELKKTVLQKAFNGGL